MLTPKKTRRYHSTSQFSSQASEMKVNKVKLMLERYKIQVLKSYVKCTKLEKPKQIVKIINDNNTNTNLLFADITSQNILKLLI